MKITNHHNLPSALVTAAHSDAYDRGAADISVTELIDSPRIRLLRQAHGDKVQQDISTMIAPLIGTAFHEMMKNHADPDAIIEQRYFAEVKGWVLSGAIDRSETNGAPMLTDYKVTSVYSLRQTKIEWENQLNVYRWLYYQHHDVWPDAQIVALCRDWRPTEARLRPNDFPPTPINVVPIASWSPARVQNYIESRIELHQQSQIAFDQDGALPMCSEQEIWQTDSIWAWKPPGAKRARALFKSKHDALSQGAPVEELEFRPGEPKRCESYCLFSGHCDQYANWMAGQELIAKM